MDISQCKRVGEGIWEIAPVGAMRVPARFYSSPALVEEVVRDRSLDQLVNVAALPGIQRYALAMPDVHEGYGFPVGGVAAFDIETGIISPGGIGYDINCGVRLLASESMYEEVKERLPTLAQEIYRQVPSGVGRGGRLRLDARSLDAVLAGGAQEMIARGYGWEEDAEAIESRGRMDMADPSAVSDRAKKRGRDQIGTMGAGNHFVEVERVERVFLAHEAQRMGLREGQVVVLIHTGSRGLGHQVATDYIRLMMQVMPQYGIEIPDRELACAPFLSQEGKRYMGAMAAAANFAWANRQMITWEVRRAWKEVFGTDALRVVYDVAHNIAKVEEYAWEGEKKRKVVVHRKGATRAFPGQPVLIPGSMGTGSYVLVGKETSLAESFGSTCHGAGRRMSRRQAKREVSGRKLKEELEGKGIAVAAGSFSGLAEEAPRAYKDVDAVVDVVQAVGIADKVARLAPIAVCKG